MVLAVRLVEPGKERLELGLELRIQGWEGERRLPGAQRDWNPSEEPSSASGQVSTAIA